MPWSFCDFPNGPGLLLEVRCLLVDNYLNCETIEPLYVGVWVSRCMRSIHLTAAVVICPVSAKAQPVQCRRNDSAWKSVCVEV